MKSWVVRYNADVVYEVVIEADSLEEAHEKFDSGEWDGSAREIECSGDAAKDAEWTENQ